MDKPDNVKQYLTNNITWEDGQRINTCIAMSLRINVAYAAMKIEDKPTGKTRVIGITFELKYCGGEFCYKAVSEDMGPIAKDCPASILNLLTATDSKWANEWRTECWQRLAKRPPRTGSHIVFDRPIPFSDGSSHRRFRVDRFRRKIYLVSTDGCRYTIRRGLWKDYPWSFVT